MLESLSPDGGAERCDMLLLVCSRSSALAHLACRPAARSRAPGRPMVTVAKPSACELEGACAPPGGAQASEGPQDLGMHRPRRVRGASGFGLDARLGARR
jgi:hypothetical protein